jgi:hypothetical protein
MSTGLLCVIWGLIRVGKPDTGAMVNGKYYGGILSSATAQYAWGGFLLLIGLLFSWLQAKPIFFSAATPPSAVWCVGISVSSALAICTALTIWLRRGAPVSIDRSSWLVGIAAGSFHARMRSIIGNSDASSSNVVAVCGLHFGNTTPQ